MVFRWCYIFGYTKFTSYLTENIILSGVIPGPREPEKTINSFLEPLVHELQLLWKGAQTTTNHGTVIVRAALTCVACDIPGR